jgi:hypothetical protein
MARKKMPITLIFLFFILLNFMSREEAEMSFYGEFEGFVQVFAQNEKSKWRR